MKKPKYTNGALYTILEDIVKQAGIKIEYCKLDSNLFGEQLSDSNIIRMSNKNIYRNDNDKDGTWNATFILAHEFAHKLIDGFYSFNEFEYEHDMATYKFIDADADKIGGALYSLALLIYEQNQKQMLENIKK